MINVQYQSGLENEINLDFIKFAVNSALSKFNKQSLDLTLRFTNNEEIQSLNRDFRDFDEVTDVLSFNQDFFDPETGSYYLGDIVISLDQASLQAVENQISLNEECAFLAIHGTLHLLGFDHETLASKQDMWQHQDAIYEFVKKIFQEKI